VKITGNDSTVVHPYLYSYDWIFDVKPIQRDIKRSKEVKQRVAFANLPIHMYTITKEKIL